MKYKTIIFDMDGTILDSLDDLADSINTALKTCGFPERSREEVRSAVGRGVWYLAEKSAPAGISEEEIAAIVKEFHAYYEGHCEDHTRPYEGIIDVIRCLREKGIRTAVVSNKPDYAVQLLCEQQFPGLFDYAAGLKDGVRRKPAPDTVNMAMEALAADQTHVLYVGDSEVDVMTAKNAQIDCISVDWGFRTRRELAEAGAEIIVSSPKALEQFLI